LADRNTEIYVYGLPSGCYEDELLPFFDEVGPVYMLRLPILFSGDIR
jgi:RNA recognition motif-containing protein